MSPSSPWLVRRPGPPRSIRLYCFAYAGGHAGVFVSWQAALEPDVEVCSVQLPGRGSRIREPAITSMPQIVEHIADAIAQQGNETPFAFFGHSLGALLAFEVACHLQQRGLPAPMHLFVSGCEAPTHRGRARALHLLSDAQLLEEVRNFNGTPPEALASSELMALVLPMLRADFALAMEYTYRPGPPLAMPLTVLAGTQDRNGCWDQVDHWAAQTRERCRVQWFNGDHFFINSQQRAVLDCVRDELRGLRLELA
ncbi:MAG: thioesterase II family protein [Luteimonas sp.]